MHASICWQKGQLAPPRGSNGPNIYECLNREFRDVIVTQVIEAAKALDYDAKLPKEDARHALAWSEDDLKKTLIGMFRDVIEENLGDFLASVEKVQLGLATLGESRMDRFFY